MCDVSMVPIIDESLNMSLKSCIVLPPKDIYKYPFGCHSGNCSPIIVAKMDADFVQGISPASNLILEVQGPGLEPSTDYENSFFGRRCWISFYANDDGVQYALSISTLELICLYGVIIQHEEIDSVLLFSMYTNLDALLPHSLAYEFQRTKMDTSTSRSHILDDFIYTCDGKMSTSQCLHIEQHNVCNTLDWKNAYKDDNDTFRIISHLRKHKSDNCPCSFKMCEQQEKLASSNAE